MRKFVNNSISMNTVDEDAITMIQNRMNNRARKRLEFKKPSEDFHQSLKHVVLRN